MDLGITLPVNGPFTPPEVVVRVAVEADRLGYGAVWTYERLLRPVSGKSVNGADVPPVYAVAYDPLETLAYVAAKTNKVKLGTSVLDAPFHVPVVLARRLATLDQLSGGRVIAGLGQGWMPEEFETANIPMKRRGRGVEEIIAAMRAVWGPDPVSFSGDFYRIAPSEINPKPLQPGGIPIIMGIFSPAALQRFAPIVDGINPIAMSYEFLEGQINEYRSAAAAAGRDTSKLYIAVRANSSITAEPIAENRPFLGGSAEQIAEDLARLAPLKINHVHFMTPNYGQGPVDEIVRLMEKLIETTR